MASNNTSVFMRFSGERPWQNSAAEYTARRTDGAPFDFFGIHVREEHCYSRAVVDGDWVFVSGTTGFDYSTMTIQDDAVAQCEQALKNIEAALKQANSSFADVVRVHYLMTDAGDFERCWPAMGKVFGEVRPACTMMVVGLADPRMKIEIEVTALRPVEDGAEQGARPRRRRRKAPRRKAVAARRSNHGRRLREVRRVLPGPRVRPAANALQATISSCTTRRT